MPPWDLDRRTEGWGGGLLPLELLDLGISGGAHFLPQGLGAALSLSCLLLIERQEKMGKGIMAVSGHWS